MLAVKIIVLILLLSLFSESFGSSQNLRIDVKPHPDDLRMKREATESDVAIPVRMREDLGQISPLNHFRSRRSISDNSHISSDDDEFQNPVYKINAFGEDLILRLHLDEHLIAPSYTTSFSWKNKTETDLPKQGLLRKCFYKGIVAGKPTSQVAVSICDSMTGSVYTDDHIYFISPLEKDSKHSQTEKTASLHTIQRRSISGKKKRSTSAAVSSCGVIDARHRRRYEQTFKINPIEEAAGRVSAVKMIYLGKLCHVCFDPLEILFVLLVLHVTVDNKNFLNQCIDKLKYQSMHCRSVFICNLLLW